MTIDAALRASNLYCNFSGGRVLADRHPPAPGPCTASPGPLNCPFVSGVVMVAKGIKGGARMMSSVPTLNARQWRRVEPLLPETRRDRIAISAIVFREIDGTGLRDVARLYGVSKTKLSEWSARLQAEGTLSRILDALGVQRAPPLQWRRGGSPGWRRHCADRGRAVMALKVDRVVEQLRASRSGRDRGARARADG